MDRRVYEILDKELDRQTTTVELIASENFASQDVMTLAAVSYTHLTLPTKA